MNLLDRLGWNAPVLLDGALGTMLQRGGLKAGKSTITQNLENPGLVLEVHRLYIEAGARAIASNTFGGNIAALQSSAIESFEREYNLEGMRLAKEAARGSSVRIAGDVGPTGEFQRDFNKEKTVKIFIRQAELMMLDPPDFFFVETMYDLREAVAALEAVKSVAGDIPAAVTMTFNRTRRGFFTMMGDPAAESLKALQDRGADAVGSNCTLAPEDMLDLLREVRDSVDLPLIMQPNAGQPEPVGGDIVYRIEPEEFAAGLASLAENGAEIVGGCCGSTPEMIRIAAGMLY